MNYLIMEEKNTEQKILAAAKSVFIEKGKDGTTMQAIADKAAINKSLLHYYFKNKERLYQKVLEISIFDFLPKLEVTFFSDIDFFDKIRIIVSDYIDLLSKNPFITNFMLNAIHRDPDGLYNLMLKTGFRLELIFKSIQKEIIRNSSYDISAKQFFTNLVSVCIFPFTTRPLLQRLMFENNDVEYDKFMEERKTVVVDFIINSLKNS